MPTVMYAGATGWLELELEPAEVDGVPDSPWVSSSPLARGTDLPLGEKYSWLIVGGASDTDGRAELMEEHWILFTVGLAMSYDSQFSWSL